MTKYNLVETQAQLDHFYETVRDVDWLCFDTEFVGEKRFKTLICLIQIASSKGNFLLDPLRLPNVDRLLDLIADPKILKITHAGENDYRLLYQQYGVLPQNTFDTQIAAGLLGYHYPSSLSKIVAGELQRHLRKGFAVTNWEARPFSQKQLDYALEDVVILEPLWQKLTEGLEATGRLAWMNEECQHLESKDFYFQDPYHEALNSNLIGSLKTREQIFLLRLFRWRRDEAERTDQSKNMVLQTKSISQIVKAMRGGEQGLKENRRIPDFLVRKYGRKWINLYQTPVTDEEKAVLKRLPKAPQEDARDELLLELLYLLMKYRCLEEEVSHSLVMPRSAIRRMKNDPKILDNILGSGWRKELLGTEFVHWLSDYDQLELKIEGGQIGIRMG
ncbi:MAG: HRDC domain-containing protein [Bacteroidota bacterium]